MNLSAQDAELLATAVSRALREDRAVSESEHRDHHRWISEQIKKEQWRAAFWQEMTKHLAKWGVVSVASALFYALYLGITTWSKHQ